MPVLEDAKVPTSISISAHTAINHTQSVNDTSDPANDQNYASSVKPKELNVVGPCLYMQNKIQHFIN